MENVVKKLGILGSSPYQLPQSGLLGALPGLTQQQQQMNGISHALNAGECLKFLAKKKYIFYFVHCSEWDYVMMPLRFGGKHNLVFSPWIDIKRPKSKARKLVNPLMDGLSSVTFVH